MVHQTTLNTLSSQSWPSPEPEFAFVKKQKLPKITACSDKLPRKHVTEVTLTTQLLHHCKPEREPARLWLHAFWESRQAYTLLTALKVALNPVFLKCSHSTKTCKASGHGRVACLRGVERQGAMGLRDSRCMLTERAREGLRARQTMSPDTCQISLSAHTAKP